MSSVEQITPRLIEIIALQKEHVSRICPDCRDPCCARVQYLFDEMDIIYLKLSGQPRPPGKKKRGKGCGLLSPTGCTLDPLTRPFACHRYVCPALATEMSRHNPALPAALGRLIEEVQALRSDLWKSYLTPQP